MPQSIVEVHQLTLEQITALSLEELAAWPQEYIWALTDMQIAAIDPSIRSQLPLNPVQLGQSGYMANGEFVPVDTSA